MNFGAADRAVPGIALRGKLSRNFAAVRAGHAFCTFELTSIIPCGPDYTFLRRTVCLRIPTCRKSDSFGAITYLVDLFLPLAEHRSGGIRSSTCRSDAALNTGEQMRIVTWNVNGLRAAIRKGFQRHLDVIQPDILLLQEVRARPEQLPVEFQQPDGWHVVWNPAVRPGYSGTAIWSRTPINVLNLALSPKDTDDEGRNIGRAVALHKR